MTDMIFVLDRDGRYLRVAPSAPELLHRAAEPGRPAPARRVPRAGRRRAPRPRSASASTARQTVHFEYVHDDRRYAALVLGPASPLLQDSVVWVARDVTDRRRTEEQLRASEERWRRISEATFEGIGFSENGVIVDTNAQLAEILGYDARGAGRQAGPRARGARGSRARDGRDRGTGAPARTSTGALRKDGSTVLVETRARALTLRRPQAAGHGRARRQRALAARGRAAAAASGWRRSAPSSAASPTRCARRCSASRRPSTRSRRTPEGTADDRELKALLRSQVSRLSNLMQDLLEYGRPPRLRSSASAVADAVRLAVQPLPARSPSGARRAHQHRAPAEPAGAEASTAAASSRCSRT